MSSAQSAAAVAAAKPPPSYPPGSERESGGEEEEKKKDAGGEEVEKEVTEVVPDVVEEESLPSSPAKEDIPDQVDDESIVPEMDASLDRANAPLDLESSVEDAVEVVPIPITERPSSQATEQEQGATTKIQSMVRCKFARERVREKCREQFEQVFDIENNRYFYYNKRTKESLWEKPTIMGSDSMDPKDEWAATQLQKMYRKKQAKKRLGDMSKAWFEKAYDPETKSFYYVRRMDNLTRWDKPMFIPKDDDAVLGEDSKRFLDRDEEIAHLKKLLAEKEIAIKRTEKARFEELDNKLRNERLLTAKQEPRGKQMDEWSMEEVVAWFESLGFPEYEPAIIQHKVDGLLLLNMEEQDWEELGVVSRLHARKIQVNMKKYQIRYENKQNKVEKAEGESSSDEDSGLSDLSISSDPSDLLEELMEGEEEGIDEEEGAMKEDEADILPPTEEELLERKRDAENVTVEVIYPGDGKSHPKNGDVVQLHYTAMLQESGKVIESSRKMRHRPFEFVVGAGQVIRGWDVAIKKFSFGERSKVTVTAKYAYGGKGYPPTIPPNVDLVFDLELIKWWKRPGWVKPLIQQPGLSQKPYTKEEEERSGAVGYGDASKVKLDGDRGEDEFSDDGED